MKFNILTLSSLLFLCAFANAQQHTNVVKTVADDRGTLDHFGHAISISGDFLIVGAYNEDDDENGNVPMEEAGSIYFFENDLSGNWNQQQKMVASDRSIDDRFGWSVAIDGDWAASGAVLEDHNESGLLYQKDAGSVYLYKRDAAGHWIQEQKIVAADRQSGDYFGSTLSMFGHYLAVGAHLEDDDVNGNNALAQAGAVYIFKKDNQDVWNEIAKVLPNDRGVGDEFGIAVSLNNNRLVVGAHAEDHNVSGSVQRKNAGAVYVFTRDLNDNWIQEQKLVASDRSPYDAFGYAVDIYDDKLIVGAFEEDEDVLGGNTQSGAGSAYTFERNAQNVWTETQKLIGTDRTPNDHFGFSVAIEHNHCVVGAYQEDFDANGLFLKGDAGAAFVFKQDASNNWNMIEKIVAFDRDTFDNFGYAVDINGTNVLVGAEKEDEDINASNSLANSGSVYVFEYPSFVGIHENLSTNNINIYPSPFNEVLFINTVDNFGEIDLKVFNLLGEVVYQNRYFNNNKIELNLKDLHAGIYILQLNSAGATLNTRVIKSNH
ncbi:MAG: T9SS type A sorting domain-containing protein [Bacteroidia bacterium]|nr:T9SS type A sorting domain-containing protein [Bacteroidia bacterium]